MAIFAGFSAGWCLRADRLMLYQMTTQPPETNVTECRAELFRDDRGQAVLIPRRFEMNGSEVLICKRGERLILTPVRKNRLLDLLATWEPLNERLPEVDDHPPLTENKL